MTTLRGLLLHDLAVERDDDHRQLAVVGEELAFDDVVGLERVDHRIEGGTVLRHLVGHERRRITRRIRLAARRQHGDEARDAVDELQLRRQAGEGLELLALQEVVALDDDEHVVLARGKARVDRLVAAELLGVGAEQLRQRSRRPAAWRRPRAPSTVAMTTRTATTAGAFSATSPSFSSPNENTKLRCGSSALPIAPPSALYSGFCLAAAGTIRLPRKSAARHAESAHADGSLHLPR